MLGQEIGMYDDPWQWVGRLTAEIWRGVRLVVDTGIHSKGWTREGDCLLQGQRATG
jgi:uncharacterized protein (DUF885 family)